MKTIVISFVTLGLAASALAQTPPPPLQVTGSVTSAAQQVDNDSNSAKLMEYRDLSRKFFLPKLTFLVRDAQTGRVLDFVATNVGRKDQGILFSAGRPGRWSVKAQWAETPHLYSNKAQTPYNSQGDGIFTVPTTVPITFKKLATSAADAPGVVASDALIAAYQAKTLHPTLLGTQTDNGRLAAAWSPSNALSLGIAWDRRGTTGSKSTYGPIGDRPPRTLNIQIAEPVDYQTNDITLSAEHRGRGYQVRAEYLYSDFANAIDTMRWQNVYATAAPGAEFDTWDRMVGTFGARPLPPDNQYHNALVNAGVELRSAGYLTASASFGRLEQDSQLLPYATMVNSLANKTLPRTSAEAKITTANLSADYVVTVVPRLTFRAFVRSTGMTNDTPSSQWQYVTSDAANLTGTVTFKNKRINLAYASDRLHAGGELTWRLPRGRTSLGVAIERDDVSRDFREADTTENRLRVFLRSRPATGVALQAKYELASRDGGDYLNTVTYASYWYAPAEAGTDADNPAGTFANHPDMRRFDVSDRLRHQADVTLTLAPRDAITLSAYARYRSDDFESDVTSTQPLLGTGLADAQARTPGNQLGRLQDSRMRYGIDVFFQPSPRATFTAFAGLDRGTSLQRSLEYNENNKQNPSAVATASLGPWTRASSQWTADLTDRTWNGGVSAQLDLVPERAFLSADYAWSLASVAIDYSGFGATNFDGVAFLPTQEFAFMAPPDVREDLKTMNLRLDLPCRQVTFMVGYRYETYDLDDWQQSGNQPWVESVGADTLLRDSSRSHQWGNRLFNLGTYLAPSYSAHIGWVGLRVNF
jgi:MtrB/PioB family decaheme-associated outer membrane protein